MLPLTATFSDDAYARALDSWTFLDLTGKTPLFTNLFGDVFLQSADGCWFLDTVEGSLGMLWDRPAALAAELGTPAGENRYLAGPLAQAAADRGLILGPGQVYTFLPPPIFTGRVSVGAIEVYDFVLAVNITGQLHRQIRDLPPGADIGGVVLG
ncbi:hypothetical protein F4553_001890 [Allocatelliglobosispora scoriae]|uniref:T6SS immunity protein Tdi1 C-terminal domain-containing protein n=1 Tax=Allocatelliglobosispora scoriae TaxID=643052 RepID=A0A841BNV9_9ACTN|nr:hypothetical protein [Allocatelliglobosispora scoriae]MBB5868511.1 hypothetical protein [Allocatelliglobosispora scoriae]